MDVEIGDIAHGLARLARWNGQTTGAHAFSVAQHCVLVEAIAAALKPQLSAKFRLAALLHDAPEYVVGDLISPFKAAMGERYKTFEERIQRAIHIRFGLPPELPVSVAQLIKKADRISAYHEAIQLADFSVADAKACSAISPRPAYPCRTCSSPSNRSPRQKRKRPSWSASRHWTAAAPRRKRANTNERNRCSPIRGATHVYRNGSY